MAVSFGILRVMGTIVWWRYGIGRVVTSGGGLRYMWRVTLHVAGYVTRLDHVSSLVRASFNSNMPTRYTSIAGIKHYSRSVSTSSLGSSRINLGIDESDVFLPTPLYWYRINCGSFAIGKKVCTCLFGGPLLPYLLAHMKTLQYLQGLLPANWTLVALIYTIES